ncbi:MAG TPA: response regulator [Opitutaceae bacterium]
MGLILLVDDSDPLREVMAAALEHDGHRVLQAADGKAAIALLRANRVDLLITDVVMPDQDGLVTLQLARKMQPELKVIVISGDSPRFAALYLDLATKFGATKTLRKPFTLPDLLASVREFCAPDKPAG